MKKRKAKIIPRIRQAFRRLYPDLSIDDPMQCVRWANATCSVLRTFNIEALPVGGSMNWLAVPPHLDDGVSPTHFSYEFEPHSMQSQFAMFSGNLPEMHAWAYLPATDEIIDMTTRHLQVQCARIAPSMVWQADDPPDYLWARASRLPEGVYYTPDINATELLHGILIRMNRERSGGPKDASTDLTASYEAPKSP